MRFYIRFRCVATYFRHGGWHKPLILSGSAVSLIGQPDMRMLFGRADNDNGLLA